MFADWQSCSDTGEELLDPVRSHYREFYVVISALLDGEEVTTCPFIWVDQDFAMARGWIQGFPEEARRGVDDAHLRAAVPGGTGHPGRLALWRRRARRAAGRSRARRVTLESVSDSGSVHTAPPIVNVRHFPRLAAGHHEDPAVHELVRAAVVIARRPRCGRDRPSFELFNAPAEEHTLLAPVSVSRGYRFTFAYTVDDLETVRELRS